MKGWLLDTNVLSELRKKNCDKHVKSWLAEQKPETFFISTISFAEIRHRIEQVDDPAFQQELEQWIDTVLRPWCAGRVLELDEDVILDWCRLVRKGRQQNHTFSQPDLFIAAQAQRHDLCVVTRNVKDFEISEVAVLNPWTAPQK